MFLYPGMSIFDFKLFIFFEGGLLKMIEFLLKKLSLFLIYIANKAF
jgi:hypothetical protein